MNRIKKFKSLLRERIADYQARYDATQDRLIFGALQEAKDTLDYIEKLFPERLDFDLIGPEIEVTGRTKEMNPGEFERTAKLGICIEQSDGSIHYENVEMKEYEARIIDGFRQALVKYKDRLIDIRHYEEDGNKFVAGTMYIVKVGGQLF